MPRHASNDKGSQNCQRRLRNGRGSSNGKEHEELQGVPGMAAGLRNGGESQEWQKFPELQGIPSGWSNLPLRTLIKSCKRRCGRKKNNRRKKSKLNKFSTVLFLCWSTGLCQSAR